MVVTREKFYNVAEVIFQQVLAVFVILILWELFKNFSFSHIGTWHIILCVVGFALCLTEGVQIFRKESIVSVGATRDDKLKAHFIVMISGFVCITIGIILKISEKSGNHFSSTHSKLGLSAWILTFFAAVGGIMASKYQSITIMRGSTIKLIHLSVGVSAYIIGIVALGFGLNYLTLFTGENGRTALIVLMSIYVLYSLIGPALSFLSHIRI